jgi:hypothetical protein
MRPLILVVALLLAPLPVAAQRDTYARSVANQLQCKSNPKAGPLLLNLRRAKYIGSPYVVSDSVSFFRLNKPMNVLGFSPVAVFGFQQGYSRLFARGPGTAPPEMVGIIVRADVASVKARLEKLGINNLRVEEHEFDLRGNVRPSRQTLTEIACWESH